MKKYNIKSLFALTLVGLMTSCQGGLPRLDTPTNFTFDATEGKFKFNTVENAEYYQVTMNRRINKETYDSLKANQKTKDMAMSLEIGEETWFFWNENVVSQTRLKDKRNNGYIEKKFSLRSYSNSATSAGDPIPFTDLAVGDYVIQTIANEIEGKYRESKSLLYTFTMGGSLATPSGFTFEGKDGKVSITIPNNYLYTNLTKTGLPTELKFEIKSGTTTKETISLKDFSWVNTIQGPTNAFNFNNINLISNNSYSESELEDLNIVVTAIGDGGDVKDSNSKVAFDYEYSIGDFSFTYTGEEGAYVGPDSIVVNAKVNNIDRPFTLTKQTAGDGVDFSYTLTDESGKITGTFECKVVEKVEWGQTKKENKAIFTLNGIEVSGKYELVDGTINVTDVGKSSGFPGGPGGGPGPM